MGVNGCSVYCRISTIMVVFIFLVRAEKWEGVLMTSTVSSSALEAATAGKSFSRLGRDSPTTIWRDDDDETRKCASVCGFADVSSKQELLV